MTYVKNITIIFLLLLMTLPVVAQLNVYELKSAFIYKFAEGTERRKGDANSKYFKIVVVSYDDEIYDVFVNKFSGKKIRGLEVKVQKVKFNKLNNSNAHIVYLSEEFNNRVDDIFSSLKRKHTLLVTNNYPEVDYTMINFIEEKGKIKFKLNSKNIKKAGIKISNELYWLGGNEDDMRKINEALKKDLALNEKMVEELNKAIEDKVNENKKLSKSNELLKKDKIDYEKKIEKLKKDLDDTKKQIENRKKKLAKQDLLLKAKEKEIRAKQDEIISQEIKIDRYRVDILEREKKFTDLNNLIRANNDTIASQENVLEKKNEYIQKQLFYRYIYIFVILVLLIVAYFIYRNYRLNRRMNKTLSEKNEEIILQKDKLQKQANTLDVTNKQLKENNFQIKAGIRYAKTIQLAVLPGANSISGYFKSFVFFRPKDHVSGDFFWAYCMKKQDRKFFFAAVVDCTGHGVPAAFMTFVGNNLLNEIVIRDGETDPVKIMDKLNEKVLEVFSKENWSSRDGMVLSLARIEKLPKGKHEVLISSAKQSVFVKFAKQDKILRLRGDAKEIGSPHYDMVDFTLHPFNLEKGDTIYMLSDGFVDQNNPARKRFGTNRVKTLLEYVSKYDIEQQHDYVAFALDNFRQNAEQRDDITMLGLEL